jgi:hypothetical protein
VPAPLPPPASVPFDRTCANPTSTTLTVGMGEIQDPTLDARSVLLVLQGLDASVKDGVIRTVFTRVNPLRPAHHTFRAPTSTEPAHDYLRREHASLPARVRLEPPETGVVSCSVRS